MTDRVRCDLCTVLGASAYRLDDLNHQVALCPVCRDNEMRRGRRVYPWDASSNRAAERVKALKPLSLLPGGPPIWLRRSDVLVALEADAIPNSAAEYDDAVPGTPGWSQPLRRATPNRVQRDVILQAILDEFALWNTPPKATVKMPNRGDASELANAIVRALERAT